MLNAAPTLETERLILRSFRDADHDALAAFYSGDAGAAFVGGPLDRRGAWRQMATFLGHWHLRGFGPFALERRDNGAWVGFCNLWRPPEFPENELGWALVASERGKGLVHEAATCVRAFAYGRLGFPTLVSYIMPDNAPSKRVALRLGAQHERAIEMRGSQVDVWRHPKPGAVA